MLVAEQDSEGREGESGRLRVAIVGIIGAGGSRNVYSK